MALCWLVAWNWNLEVMFLICGNPHPQFSSTTQCSLHFYKILEEEKKWGGKAAGIFTIPPLTRGLNTFRWDCLGISVITGSQTALDNDLDASQIKTQMLPNLAYSLVSVIAGKIWMSAVFPYGEIIWLKCTWLVAVLSENPTWAKALAGTQVHSPLSGAETKHHKGRVETHWEHGPRRPRVSGSAGGPR